MNTPSKKGKQYITVMAIGIILNIGLYMIAHIFSLPVWMDSIGTVYVAVALEPAAGLIIAFITNFFQSAFIYGTNSIMYFFVGASAALCFGLLSKKSGTFKLQRLLIAAPAYIACSTVVGGLLNMWRNFGKFDSKWEMFFSNWLQDFGASIVLSEFFGVFVLKLFDSILICILVPLLLKLTPKKFKTI